MIMPGTKKREKPVTTEQAAPNGRGVWNIVGIVLCIILVPILILNCILLVQGMVNEDKVPSIGGNVPLIVLTESMEPKIKDGDVIVCKTADPDDVKVGDVISFFDPEGTGTSTVTHRVIEILIDPDTGAKSFRTQGDNNNIEDRLPVPAENLVGIWSGVRIPALGNVIMFMQSTLGLIVCIFLPITALIAYELIRRKRQDSEKQTDIELLKAELEALKAARAEAAPAGESAAEEATSEEQTKDE